jgi:hypothetical protein
MKKTANGTVEQVVRGLLDRHAIESPPVPVERLVRELDVEFRSEHYPDLALRGFIVQKSPAVKKGLIFINSSQHPNVQRFALAHEIGHLLLAGTDVHVDRRRRVSSHRLNARDPEEIKADEFAAELLMPRYMLAAGLEGKKVDPNDDKALVRLASQFRVSLVAMMLRLQQIGLLIPYP